MFRIGKLCNVEHGLSFVFQELAFLNAIYLVNAIEERDVLINAYKPALESDHVTKVIHDYKRDNEALYFQFAIKLNDVMDTQMTTPFQFYEIAYSLIEEQ